MIPIPPHVVEAARLIERFFAEKGVEEWSFMGICSRKAYDKLKASAKSVTTEKTLEHVAAKLNS